VVDLKFFCGLSIAEIAALQQVSQRTVQRQWEKARALLRHALQPQA
jgi:DNA-directed RNA polymerase specialized sigma24 family protein